MSDSPEKARKCHAFPKPLVGRPTFNVGNVKANHRELAVWFAWLDVAKRLVSQRAILATRFHEALSFAREHRPLEPYHNRGMEVVNRAWRNGKGDEQDIKILESHLRDVQDYGFFVFATSQRGAESLIYVVDSVIKFAAEHAKIASGKSDKNLIGGKYIAPSITLLEGFRIVANWQRHHVEWDRNSYNGANFNHKGLKEMELWRRSDTPVAFLKVLGRRTYFELEHDILDALEFLVCEVGMKHPQAGSTAT